MITWGAVGMERSVKSRMDFSKSSTEARRWHTLAYGGIIIADISNKAPSMGLWARASARFSWTRPVGPGSSNPRRHGSLFKTGMNGRRGTVPSSADPPLTKIDFPPFRTIPSAAVFNASGVRAGIMFFKMEPPQCLHMSWHWSPVTETAKAPQPSQEGAEGTCIMPQRREKKRHFSRGFGF